MRYVARNFADYIFWFANFGLFIHVRIYNIGTISSLGRYVAVIWNFYVAKCEN